MRREREMERRKDEEKRDKRREDEEGRGQQIE